MAVSRNIHRSRGTALVMTIVVSVILTGLAMTLAWLGSVHANMAGQIPKIDASYYAAEAGAQHAVWKFKKDNTWRAPSSSPLTGSISMYNTTWNYSVSVTDKVGDALLAWKFDENTGSSTADSSGHGNTGIFHGGVSWFSPGRSGSCLQFNGVDGYVDCGNSPTTNLTGNMTFSAWVKMNSGYYDQKIGGNQNGTYGGYKLCVYNSKVEFEVRDASNNAHLNRDVAGGTMLTMGTWYHLVGVYNESGHYIKTYVNGKVDRTLLDDGTGTGLNDVPANALGSTTGNFVMGREPWDPTKYYFDGWMDDIRIWNRELSANEIATLYDTTVDVRAVVTGGPVSNVVQYSVSIPTPPAPTIPAISTGKDYTLANTTINGDLGVNGKVTCKTGNSTIHGNLTYKTIDADNHLTVDGKSSAVSSLSLPSIDYAYLHTQASTWGKVVSGDSTGQTFAFNTYGGNKVIWIKGNLTDPVVTIGGTYAAGGTFVVDGKVNFTSNATLGASGYPVYIVAEGDITQTGGQLSLNGALYTKGKFTHKNCDITGPIVALDTITNNASGTTSFTAGAIPWFDNRAVPQPPTLPLYTANHTGLGP